MQFFDLKKQYENLKVEIGTAVHGVLEKGVFIGGEEVGNFEKSAADYLDVKYAVSLNSGTDALFLALKAIGVKSGDEVITTPFTFIATVETIAACGAKPIFVDINPDTFNIDPAAFFIKLDSLKKTGGLDKVKAVIPVHLFGQMADMEAIMEIAGRFNIKVVEDCAQAIGASQEIRDKKNFAGTLGDVNCFSFFPTKNLGAYGDGGMAATNSDELAQKIKLLKSHGSSSDDKYKYLVLGVNSRLDAIQAAILNVKIKYLSDWNEKRRKIAEKYSQELENTGDIIVPKIKQGNTHVFHQYTVRVSRRDELRAYLKEKGIPSMVYYPAPLHLQKALEYLGGKEGDFPEAECASKEVLSLPIYPELEQKDQDAVIKAVNDFYEKKA